MPTARRTTVLREVSFPAPPTEAQFSRQIIDLARTLGYRTWHDRSAKFNDRGWPDLVLVRVTERARKGRLIFIELKGPRGVVSDEQQEWLDTLIAAGQEAYLWRSTRTTLEEIMEILR